MKKIVLVGINTRHTHSSLATACLEAFLRTANRELEIVRLDLDMNQGVEAILAHLVYEAPQIVGFSTYIWNLQFVLAVSGALRSVNPELKIILGGPEVSFEVDEIFTQAPWVDIVVRGEGEITFSETIDRLVENRSPSGIKGISWRADNEVFHEPNRKSIENLDKLPSPFQFGIYGRGKGFTYYEASRGCPFSCAYCLSSVLGALRCFSIDRVLADLDWFFDSGFSQIRFADRTFNFDQERAISILEHILKRNSNQKFHLELKPDLLSDSLIELLGKADPEMFHVEIGIQSTNVEVLQEVGRVQQMERVIEGMGKLRQKTRCHIHLDMLAGMPGETFSQFKTSLDEAFSWNPSTIQVGLVKVLKGTTLRARVKSGELSCMPYPPYAIVRSRWLSAQEVVSCQEIGKLVEGIFNHGRFPGSIKFFSNFIFNRPSEFFLALADFWRATHRLFFSFSPENVFRGLSDFLENLKIDSVVKTSGRSLLEHERQLNQKVPTGSRVSPFLEFLGDPPELRLDKGFRIIWFEKDPLGLYDIPSINLEDLPPAPVIYGYQKDLSRKMETSCPSLPLITRYMIAWLLESNDLEKFSEAFEKTTGKQCYSKNLQLEWEKCLNSEMLKPVPPKIK